MRSQGALLRRRKRLILQKGADFTSARQIPEKGASMLTGRSSKALSTETLPFPELILRPAVQIGSIQQRQEG
jgi:hypothetical protein